ncbi:MAG TPA: hypothetical protein VJL35_15995, partial [Gemmatimonadaceae bacterium]|nr:hypothetical protein [Gemmatimonadaceae bacterium]
EYDYAIRDSLQIKLGPRTLDVYEVRVRPKNDREPRAVGAVYIDRESGEVVRMAFSFTRSALKDKELEDVSVVLENGLIEGRFWLPRRQEIEIRRTGTWLDYPARGIIRGRWEICCYEVNVPINPGLFAGPEIQLAPRGTPSPVPFAGNVLDSLPPDVRAVTDADVAKVQEEARALVRSQALARTRSTSLSARSVSDFVRANRVEGLALGGGITRRLGEGFSVTARARYGLSDEKVKARGGISFRRASGAGFDLAGYDDYSDAGDIRETSQLVSSIAAQEFGTDFTDPYGARGGSLTVRTRPLLSWTLSLEGAIERQRELTVHATPASGRYEETLFATPMRERRATLSFDRPTRLGPWGLETQLHVDGSLIQYKAFDDDYRNISRFTVRGNFERPVGRSRIVFRTFGAWLAAGDVIPAQHLVFLGGPTSAPGYRYHQFMSRAGVSQRAEIQFPVPFPSFSLGRYGKTPASITLAPFANAAWVDRSGWHPSVGIGALTIFDLLRFDVARGLRDGRWTFSVDVSRDLWSIL